MDTRAEPHIRAVLDQGERLLWSGRPRQGLRLRPQSSVLALLLVLVVFSLVLQYQESGRIPPISRFIPILAVLLVVASWFFDRARRSTTYYGVTDRRVLILSANSFLLRTFSDGPFQRRHTSIALRDLTDARLDVHADGSGSITFAKSWTPPTFEMIDDAERVYRLIEEARRPNAARGGD